MKLVGHRTESIYRRDAIADEGMLLEGTDKLAALHLLELKSMREAPSLTCQMSGQGKPKAPRQIRESLRKVPPAGSEKSPRGGRLTTGLATGI